MVVVSAVLFLDQLLRWAMDESILRFNPVDSADVVEFVRSGEAVAVWTRGQGIGESLERPLKLEVLEACIQRHENTVSRLAEDDAGKQDLEAAMQDGRALLSSLVPGPLL